MRYAKIWGLTSDIFCDTIIVNIKEVEQYMEYQSGKKAFYIFVDAHNALNDVKNFRAIKKRIPETFYEECLNSRSVEIFNEFLARASQYYNVELVLTPTDAEYTEHLLRGEMEDDYVHTVDYMFAKDDEKSEQIEHYLTWSKKDKDVSKVINYIILDSNKIALSDPLKKHLVDINPKTKPLSAEALNQTLVSIGYPELTISEVEELSM